jgi:hypothetical protein
MQKSTLLLLFILAVLARPSFAQETSFGLKGGLNISSLGGNNSQVASAKVGFHAGAYVSTPLSDQVSFQPELLYSQQGFRVTSAYSSNGDPFNINYNYLNLPLIFKIYPNEGFNIQLGPQVGYLINVIETNGSSGSLSGGKKFDFGIDAGLGYELESGLNFSARYNLGLSNTPQNSNNLALNSANRVFQLSLGYTFGQ